MKIRQLRYFLLVAEEMSFARAAVKAHIEPSPLSRALKELEAELGVSLFQRARGRIRLTWAGEVFQNEARRILDCMEGARTRVQSAAQGFRGRLRIGLADSLAQPRLTRLLARSREEEPLTEVRIVEMTVNEMITALDQDQIDAGFTVHTEPYAGLIKEVVWTDRPAAAIPRNHPLLSFEKVPLAEVLRHSLILGHPELCAGGHHVVGEWFNDPTLPSPKVAEYVSGHEPMMMLVAAGYGIGLGLASQITLYRHPDVIIRPVADDIPSIATYIALRDTPPSDELRRFVLRAQQSDDPAEHLA